MKIPAVFATAAIVLGAVAAYADDDDPSADETARINEMLAGMQCEMDDDDIEKEDGGFDLDDVICADGQYDIKLDGNFEIIEKRAE